MSKVFSTFEDMTHGSDHLIYCLQEVEKKLNWKKSVLWKDPDYTKLSEVIYKESNITISTNTLKRLFGKIKYANTYNPQKGTKDALTKYLGYENWDDFVNLYKHQDENLNNDVPNLASTKVNFNKTIYRFLSFIGILLILVLIAVYSNKSNNINEPYTFELKDSISQVPFTVSINYDLQKIKSDSVYANFNYLKSYLGLQVIKLNKSKHVNNFTYQIPGYYQIDLEIDNRLIEQKNILAMSDGWDSHILPENHNQEGFWLDNKIETTHKNGYLYFSPDSIKAKGFDSNSVYYIANRLFKEFEIDGDNFELEIKFKNTKEQGGITCYDFILNIVCSNETNFISLMEEGCGRFSGLKMGESILGGVDNDLSNFKVDTKSWNTLNIFIENKKVKVSINNELIYKGSYNNPNGMILGIENIFKGSGMIDYLKIEDLNSKQVFFDDFKD